MYLTVWSVIPPQKLIILEGEGELAVFWNFHLGSSIFLAKTLFIQRESYKVAFSGKKGSRT